MQKWYQICDQRPCHVDLNHTHLSVVQGGFGNASRYRYCTTVWRISCLKQAGESCGFPPDCSMNHNPVMYNFATLKKKNWKSECSFLLGPSALVVRKSPFPSLNLVKFISAHVYEKPTVDHNVCPCAGHWEFRDKLRNRVKRETA